MFKKILLPLFKKKKMLLVAFLVKGNSIIEEDTVSYRLILGCLLFSWRGRMGRGPRFENMVRCWFLQIRGCSWRTLRENTVNIYMGPAKVLNKIACSSMWRTSVSLGWNVSDIAKHLLQQNKTQHKKFNKIGDWGLN